MEVSYLASNPIDATADLLVVSTFSDAAHPLYKALDKALDGRLTAVADGLGFQGRSSDSFELDTLDGLNVTRIIVLGAGKRGDFKPADVRSLGARAAMVASQRCADTVVFVIPPAGRHQDTWLQLATEGAHLGLYKFTKYKTKAKPEFAPKSFAVAPATPPKGKVSAASRAAIRRGSSVARATADARNLVNEPAGFMSPTRIAKHAQSIAKEHGMTIKVLGRKECEKLGMGMFLGVAKGADEEPKLIHMTYKPKRKPKKRVALVGKGVMFDSGGYSLKPSAGMLDMKIDMAGSAAVLASMAAIAEQKCPYEVHAIAACCENMVSGGAYKLGDVLTAMDGTTVEINNTDAEGRLTLGDAITYARTVVEADEILDFATLTGACMVALGMNTAGVMSDSARLRGEWLKAAETAGENMWELPLDKELKGGLRSAIADLKNCGPRFGGAITAGLFLKHFAGDTPWVHVDIAGPAYTGPPGATNDENGFGFAEGTRDLGEAKGGTGFAVASIVGYLCR